jgi:hypothetical protein
MKVLVPLCGDSVRFKSIRPKWMLTHPKGELMIERALSGLFTRAGDLYFVIRKDHDEQFDASKVLYKCFGLDIHILVLPFKPKTQNDTIVNGITFFKLEDEPLLVRDGDSYIELNKFETSYCQVFTKEIDSNDRTDNKGMYSYDKFSVGGYYVTEGRILSDNYVEGSPMDIVKQLPRTFAYNNVTKYEDYGTIEEWNKILDNHKTYFIDIDGVIFKNCSKYFFPYWGYEEPLKKNIDWINSLPYESQVILVTARPSKYRGTTELMLNRYKIKYNFLLMDCNHSKRIIINDYTGNPTCEAINVKRNEDGSIEKNISNS